MHVINKKILYILSILFIFLWNNFVYAQGELERGIPELCYKCHAQLKEILSQGYLHSPFQQGRCLSCHAPHASKLKALLKDDVNSLCLDCHKITKIMGRKKCTDCHLPHAGKNKYFLVKTEEELCISCHEGLKEQIKKSHIHPPFKDNKCVLCHGAHISSEFQLRSNPDKLCKNCHKVNCKVGNISISFATENMNCLDCHTGHSSEVKGLLGPYGHKAFLEKRCEDCHNPIEIDKKITTKMPTKQLCVSCHKEVKLKESDPHLSDKGCSLCHSYHASQSKNLTIKESKICFSCHEDIGKKLLIMEKTIKSFRCVPVKKGECFNCHIPPHSNNPLYFKEGKIQTCSKCHERMYKISHPLEIKDPRNGEPITCVTCHSMHSAKAEFMLYLDRRKALCIQCHKKY